MATKGATMNRRTEARIAAWVLFTVWYEDKEKVLLEAVWEDIDSAGFGELAFTSIKGAANAAAREAGWKKEEGYYINPAKQG